MQEIDSKPPLFLIGSLSCPRSSDRTNGGSGWLPLWFKRNTGKKSFAGMLRPHNSPLLRKNVLMSPKFYRKNRYPCILYTLLYIENFCLCYFRWFLCFKRAIVRLQAMLRVWSDRRAFLYLKAMTIRIQTMGRMLVKRWRYKDMRRAAIGR